MVILLGHKKQVGKDTFARLLIEEFYKLRNNDHSQLKVQHIEQVAFANALYKVARDLFGIQVKTYYDKHPECKNDLTIGNLTVRDILIRVGNDMRQIDPDVWIKFVKKQCQDTNTLYIVTDLRYPNESESFLDSIQLKIIRPDVAPTDDVADCALDGYYGWAGIINNTSIEVLRREAHEILRKYVCK